MDWDGGLINYITQSADAFGQAINLGVRPEVLAGSGRIAWEFVEKYQKEHGSLPGLKLVEETCGTPFRQLDGTALTYIVEKILHRDLFNTMRDGVSAAQKDIENMKPEDALEKIERLVDTARRKRSVGINLKQFTDLGEQVIEMYLRTKRGEIGVPLPWPSMNEMTMGLWPQTLTFFAARPGTGKTFAITIILRHAWQEGFRVLMISPEMSAEEIAERGFSIQFHTCYSDIVSGSLGEFREETFFEGIRGLKGEEGFYILDDNAKMEPRSIEAAIDIVKPAVVGIDSVYMIRSGPGNRYERMLTTVDWLRELAKNKNIPVIALTQFNKEAANRKRGGTMETFALTDAITWDAHNLIGLNQDEDMKKDKRMEFLAIKVRRPAFKQDVHTNWDFDTMDFSEIGRDGGSRDTGYDDDEVPF